jgi:hypothetical protein
VDDPRATDVERLRSQPFDLIVVERVEALLRS